MYLPRTLPLCEPHVATWIGASGRRYDFAVSRPATTWLDEAAVFLLVKCEGKRTEVLHVGHACSLHRRFGMARERCPELWRRALTAGMTHVHLRFEACSEQARQAEVDDLVAALRPALLIQPGVAEEAITEPAPALAEAAPASEDVLVPYRARLKPMRWRDPHIDIEAFDLDFGRSDLPFGHAYEAPRSLRADPAREYAEGFDDFEAMLREAQEASEPAAAVLVLPAQGDVVDAVVAKGGAEEAVEMIAVPGAIGQLAPAGEGEEELVEMVAEEAGLPPPQAEELVPAVDPAPAEVGSAQPEGPVAESRTRGQARGRFGRWLHALAERSGRWLGTPSWRATGKAAADGSLSSPPLAAPAETAVAIAETTATRDTAVPAATGTNVTLPPAAVAAEANGELDVAETAALPVAAEVISTPVPLEAPTADTRNVPPAAEAAAAEPVVGIDGLGKVAAAVAETRGDLIAEPPGVEMVDLLADEDDEIVLAQPASALADEPITPVGEERQDTRPRRLAVDARRGDASPPASFPQEEGGAIVEAAKRACAFDPAKPVLLFADEVCSEAGADILADAIITVCGTDASAQFAFAGEGALRGDLQHRLWGAGFGERCRFLGDVPADRFARLLAAADILIVPARARRGEELARLAISQGKWVLVTHQSEITCVRHGLNGLVTYDNPGSLVWGIRELLGRTARRQQEVRAEAA